MACVCWRLMLTFPLGMQGRRITLGEDTIRVPE